MFQINILGMVLNVIDIELICSICIFFSLFLAFHQFVIINGIGKTTYKNQQNYNNKIKKLKQTNKFASLHGTSTHEKLFKIKIKNLPKIKSNPQHLQKCIISLCLSLLSHVIMLIRVEVIISFTSFAFRITNKLFNTQSNEDWKCSWLGSHFKEISCTCWTWRWRYKFTSRFISWWRWKIKARS
jgi:hypothetical protein